MRYTSSKLGFLRKYRYILSQVILGLIFGAIAIFSMLISPLFILQSSTILQVLIEVDAAILGFWGIILVYALTALDNRRDSLETKKFDVAKYIAERRDPPIAILSAMKLPDEHIAFLEGKIQNTINSFNKLRREGIINSVMLTISIVVAIVGLGLEIPRDIVWLYFIIVAAVWYFLSGVAFIFMSLWEFRAEEAERAQT